MYECAMSECAKKLLKANLQEVVFNFTRWRDDIALIELDHYEPICGPWQEVGVAAVWGIFNHIITAVAVTPQITEVSLQRICGRGTRTVVAWYWDRLLRNAKSIGWISSYEPIETEEDREERGDYYGFVPEDSSIDGMSAEYESNPSLFESRWKAYAQEILKIKQKNKPGFQLILAKKKVSNFIKKLKNNPKDPPIYGWYFLSPIYDSPEEGWKLLLDMLKYAKWENDLFNDEAAIKARTEKAATQFLNRLMNATQQARAASAAHDAQSTPTSSVTLIAQSVNIGGDVAGRDTTREPSSSK